jgi:hypothetical protein
MGYSVPSFSRKKEEALIIRGTEAYAADGVYGFERSTTAESSRKQEWSRS